MSLEYPDAPNVVRLPKPFKAHPVELAGAKPRTPLNKLAALVRAYGDSSDEWGRELLAQAQGHAEALTALATKAKSSPYHKIALSVGLSDIVSDIETLIAIHTPLETIE